MGKLRSYIIVFFFAIFLCLSFGGQPQIYKSNHVTSNIIGKRTMSLEKRYPNEAINEVFKDNILLTLHYLSGQVKKEQEIDWLSVQKPFQYELMLAPAAVFAFHDVILPQFSNQVAATTNAHFNAADGFRSNGYLYGDGVCHLASLLNWAARDAGLEVTSLVNHDFATIPEVPGEFGVSIMTPDANQNLYIKNPFHKPVIFKFEYNGENLSVSILKG